MFAYKTFQFRLFMTYLIAMLFFASVIGVPMYWYLRGNIESNISGNVEQKMEISNAQLDQWFQEFSSITNQLYLDNTDDSVIKRLDKFSSSGVDADKLRVSNSIYNNLSLFTQIHKGLRRMSVFTTDGNVYSNKNYSLSTSQILEKFDLEAIREAKGATVIRFFEQDPWTEAGSEGNQIVLSFTRQLRAADREIGFFEVQFTAEELMQTPFRGKNPLPDVNFVMYTDKTILYPFPQEQANIADTVQTVRSLMAGAAHFSSYLATGSNQSSYIVANRSINTPITIMYVIPKKELLAPLRLFRNVTFLAVLFFILMSTIVFYLLSKTLTSPLIKLRKAIDFISLDDRSPNIENKYNEDAIEMLNRSFRRMNERLKQSLEESVQFRTMQLRSQFEVLQAQINPHFLFNMLSVIKALADRERNEQISDISGKLAKFLQYPLATNTTMAHIGEEVQFVKDYLYLIKTRYMHRLVYTIDVAEQAHRIQIPKLTLQPLVENCIQYGFINNPTLIIHIHVNIYENWWEILIKDNGPGFHEDKLEQLRQQINENTDKVRTQQALDPLTIGGMGLISTFTRLKLLYKDDLSFMIGNGKESGAFIAISGLLDHKER